MPESVLNAIAGGDRKALARAISLVENEGDGYQQLLESLPGGEGATVIGVTGPPGSGKSTLVDALVAEVTRNGQAVAILCIDPSSPFHHGALLGDRIRMSTWYNHPKVFIRSLASRGSLGGLHPNAIEITDLLKTAKFDYIIVETVGVGQNEVEIAGLANVTVVVLVPESGDAIQTMKSGVLEIADIFVVNKSDRPEADLFVRNLRERILPPPDGMKEQKQEPVIVKTIATQKEGIAELWNIIQQRIEQARTSTRHVSLLADRAYALIRQRRMKGIDKNDLMQAISRELKDGQFNLYRFIAQR